MAKKVKRLEGLPHLPREISRQSKVYPRQLELQDDDYRDRLNRALWDWRLTIEDLVDLTVTGGGGGHIIQDEGVDLTTRARLNFVGAGVTATDDSGNGRTNVTIPGGTSVLGAPTFVIFDVGSGTWNVPSGVSGGWLTMIAPGSGGQTSGATNGGGGGGEGERVTGMQVTVTDGGTVAWTVSDGGAADTDGGTTTFGGFVVLGGKTGVSAGKGGVGGGVNGGAGGNAANPGTGGIMGLASATYYWCGGGGGGGGNTSGAAGGNGVGAGGRISGGTGGITASSKGGGGGGAASVDGPGANGGAGNAVGSDASATSYGAGGGGGGGGSKAGGKGGPGRIIFAYIVP